MNTTHSSSRKTPVHNTPKLESPLNQTQKTTVDNSPKLGFSQIQTHDSQQKSIGFECIRRISSRQKKSCNLKEQ